MSYADVAAMAADPGLADRVKGCAATQGVGDADTWWYTHRWLLSASPGWAEAWAYARSSGRESIGLDETVITDGDILAAVQTLIDSETIP